MPAGVISACISRPAAHLGPGQSGVQADRTLPLVMRSSASALSHRAPGARCMVRATQSPSASSSAGVNAPLAAMRRGSPARHRRHAEHPVDRGLIRGRPAPGCLPDIAPQRRRHGRFRRGAPVERELAPQHDSAAASGEIQERHADRLLQLPHRICADEHRGTCVSRGGAPASRPRKGAVGSWIVGIDIAGATLPG